MAGIADFLVYFPSPQDFNNCDPAFTPQTIERGPRPLRYYERIGSRSRKVVLYFHGNAGSACDRLPLADDFEDPESYHFVFAEYSGYSSDTGPRSEAAFTEDGVNLFDHIRTMTDLPITVVGRSLGTAVATFVAAQRNPLQLILVSPLTSIVDVGRYLYPIPKGLINIVLRRHRFEASKWAKEVGTDVLIMQGDLDNIVPLHIAETQKSNFTSVKSMSFEVIEGAGHNDISTFSSYKRELNRFLKNQPR